jgi:hypothetical protein
MFDGVVHQVDERLLNRPPIHIQFELPMQSGNFGREFGIRISWSRSPLFRLRHFPCYRFSEDPHPSFRRIRLHEFHRLAP